MLSKMRLAYGDEIYVVILGVNPTPDWSRINNFAAETNHEGSALAATKETLETYGILSQSTKIGLDGAGAEVFRQGYGGMNEADWTELLDKLTSS